jgi:hypothetical protein
MKKIIKVADLRELLPLYHREEITISRFAELLSHIADNALTITPAKAMIQQKILPPHIISRVVAEAFNLTDETEINKNTRKREIVKARQAYMYFLTKYTTKTLYDIGLETARRNHATVLHACKTVQNMIDCRDKFYMPILSYVDDQLHAIASDSNFIIDQITKKYNLDEQTVKSIYHDVKKHITGNGNGTGKAVEQC